MKLDYRHCASVALTFKTRGELRSKASSEYQWLRRNGLIDQACQHMERVHRSLSDDDIAAIAAKYSHRTGLKLGDQSVYNAAKKRGILDRVCAHMSGDRYRILSDEQIAELAARFDTRTEFARNDNGAYQTATKRGILDAICAHMDGRKTRRLSDSEILEIASTFKARNDFKIGDFGAYTTAIRRGLIVQACAHMQYGAWGFREDRSAVLYQFHITLPDGLVLYKVGITNRKPNVRLTTMGLFPGAKARLTHCIKFARGRDARMTEKALHRLNDSNRYAGPPIMNNGNTELFTVPAFSEPA